MSAVFDSGYARQFLAENSDIVASWEKSSDPMRLAVAVLIKQTAGGITA